MGDASRETKQAAVFQFVLYPLIVGIVGALSGFMVAKMELEGVRAQTESKLVASVQELLHKELQEQRTYNRLLKSRINEQEAELAQMRDELTRLKGLLATKYNEGTALKNYLAGMPNAAWIKKTNIPWGSTETHETPRIEMWYLNKAYERIFDVTDRKYKGRTDFEVGLWSQEIAQAFYENDLEALSRMGGYWADEKFPTASSKGVLVKGRVSKWVVEVEGFVAIAGLVTIIP